MFFNPESASTVSDAHRTFRKLFVARKLLEIPKSCVKICYCFRSFFHLLLSTHNNGTLLFSLKLNHQSFALPAKYSSQNENKSFSSLGIRAWREEKLMMKGNKPAASRV